MKTRYILPALLALGTVVTSTQATATGLTYDPYEIYYSKYYGIGSEQAVTQTTEQEGQEFYDPYADYYNTYYDMDVLADKSTEVKTEVKKEASTDDADMADPTNYFKW